ncbi:redoxin family protein [Rheinheimera marina]|uniref:Redoxin family protein n=1 Tax=Rheinheimera marina TaxID=1774958 RepID=A0ABV9JGM0_9GAMM
MSSLKSLLGALVLLTGFASQAALPDYKTVPLQQFGSDKQLQLGQLDANKPLYVKLWASWCKPCMEQMPHFEQLYKDYGDQVNFVAVNININEQPAEVNKVIQRFGLTMPVWLDQNGQLALALGLVGTPFSVLMNSQGQQVYSSHESDAALDGFIQRLAQGQQLPPEPADKVSPAQQQQQLATVSQGEQLLFITATWCDWYLADTRPTMAAQCKQAQTDLNALVAKLPKANWQGLVNHLWTDDKALADFNRQYQMKVPFRIDQYGVLFQHFNVRSIPVLLKLKDGKVLAQIDDFSDQAKVLQQLQ